MVEVDKSLTSTSEDRRFESRRPRLVFSVSNKIVNIFFFAEKQGISRNAVYKTESKFRLLVT